MTAHDGLGDRNVQGVHAGRDDLDICCVHIAVMKLMSMVTLMVLKTVILGYVRDLFDVRVS